MPRIRIFRCVCLLILLAVTVASVLFGAAEIYTFTPLQSDALSLWLTSPWMKQSAETAARKPEVRDLLLEGGIDPACASRDEWHPPCNASLILSLRRFVLVGPFFNRYAGAGHSMAMVGHIVRLAIKYNLTPVFSPPIEDRAESNLGEYFGLASSPDFLHEDDDEVQEAEVELLPTTQVKERLAILDSQTNRTNVTYDPQVKICPVAFADGNWLDPTEGTAAPPECTTPWFHLREWFRSGRETSPSKHESCSKFLPPKRAPFNGKWVVAVHIRRGDIVIDTRESWKRRNLPHAWYVIALGMVLRGIARLESGAEVAILVFCEGADGQIIDESGAPVSWDIESSVECTSMGLKCFQVNVIDDSVLDVLDCLIAADVLIGSISGFTNTAGILSSNVRVVPAMWHKYPRQDTIEVHFKNRSDASTHDVSQASLDEALRTWKHCGSHAMAKRNPYVYGYRINGLV